MTTLLEGGKTYDPRCHDLANIFLSDEPPLHNEKNIADLASIIQTAIEEQIEYLKQEASDNSQFGAGA